MPPKPKLGIKKDAEQPPTSPRRNVVENEFQIPFNIKIDERDHEEKKRMSQSYESIFEIVSNEKETKEEKYFSISNENKWLNVVKSRDKGPKRRQPLAFSLLSSSFDVVLDEPIATTNSKVATKIEEENDADEEAFKC